MTTWQIVLMEASYLVFFAVVISFTRAPSRRVMGSLAGGAAAGLLGLGMIALAEAEEWWRIPSGSAPYFRLQLFTGVTVSMAPTFLILWRVVRRFGWRGLAVFLAIVAVIGPPRDYLIARSFPEWMVFSPGFIPILVDAMTYVGMIALGYAAMRSVAGPDAKDLVAS
jgi:hypothetical protein